MDGDELAHGDAPGGPLVELRLATETRPRSSPDATLAARVADLRLVRLAAPSGPPEIDPTQWHETAREQRDGFAWVTYER